MAQAYVLVSVVEWRKALASQAATQRFLEEVMENLDDAAGTGGWVGPKMPWHNWLNDRDDGETP